MEKINYCRLFLTALHLCMLTVVSTHAQDMLYIDCGADRGYLDGLGIEWVADDSFIKTGTKAQLESRKMGSSMFSIRYFEEGRSKNCYVLPVRNQTTYLLRIQLYPGDPALGLGIVLPVTFNITFNNNLWFTYSAQNDTDRFNILQEAIFYTFDRNEVYACLLKGPEGSPFVNSLELRELSSTAYSGEVIDERKLLTYAARYNTGTKPADDSILRYPDDINDRYWFPTPTTEFPGHKTVESALEPESSFSTAEAGYNWPPTKVLADAWVGLDLSSPPYTIFPGTKRFYVAYYIQEIRSSVIQNLTYLQENPLGMIIGVNDNLREVNLTSLNDVQYTFTTRVINAIHLNLTVRTQPWSKRTAILNAFEVLYSDDIDTSAIFPKDGAALNVLQSRFGLQDWTGDPCYPVAWDWLTCDPKTSRVVKLALSSMKISGPIPEEIGTLTELSEIHLDNNNLNGSIPQSLKVLNKLQVLVLDNNNLSGEIPVGFVGKAGFSFRDNPGLCLPGQCGSSPPPPQTPSDAVKGASPHIRKFGLSFIVAVGVIVLARMN